MRGVGGVGGVGGGGGGVLWGVGCEHATFSVADSLCSRIAKQIH